MTDFLNVIDYEPKNSVIYNYALKMLAKFF